MNQEILSASAAFFTACDHRNESLAYQILQLQPNAIFSCTDTKKTFLHAAAEAGFDSVIRKILQDIPAHVKQAYIDSVDASGQTPLLLACLHTNVSAAHLLIDAGCEYTQARHDNKTPLYFAAYNNMPTVISSVLRTASREHIDKTANDGTTAVLAASLRGHNTCATLLIQSGANVLHTSPSGYSIFHYSAINGLDTCISSSFSRIEDPHQKQNLINATLSPTNETPFLLACGSGHETTANLLLDLGADCKKMGHNQLSGLHLCAQMGLSSTLEKIGRTCIGLIDITMSTGYSALMWACKKSHVSCVRILLGLNPDILLCNPTTNQTALHYAAESGNLEIASLLLEHIPLHQRIGFIAAKDLWDDTAITCAYKHGHIVFSEYFSKLIQNIDKKEMYI